MKSDFTVSVAWLALASSPVAAQVTGTSTGQSSGGGAAVDPIPPRPSSSDGTASAESAQLGDIVVTARRVSESLQKSQVAITDFNAAALRERAIDSVADIGKFTHSLDRKSTRLNSRQ